MSYPFKLPATELAKIYTFDHLISQFKFLVNTLPDQRKGNNTTYRIMDAVLGAFSVFFTQSPSFLAYQAYLQEAQGKNNAQSLFQIINIPSDNQIRNLLDPISPSTMTPMFDYVFTGLNNSKYLENYRSINHTLLVALDAVCYFSSHSIHCDSCRQQHHKSGEITYSHSAITPVLVAPGNPHVISLAPEFITPQDGLEKQDSENAAAERWLQQHAQPLSSLGITFLGDDLYAHQPLCKVILQQKCHFILTCKPDSHKTTYEWVDELAAISKVETVTVPYHKGKKSYVNRYRFINQIPLRDGEDALNVNWCELYTTNQKDEVVYKNAFITDHLITANNVAGIVEAGRTRWKIENENNNTLKTKGYHLEHNFGHGKKYLSQFLMTLNLLAFLFHTVLNLMDTYYQLIRAKLPTRKTFFDDLRALTRYMYFESWQHLMEFMFKGLKLKLPDTG